MRILTFLVVFLFFLAMTASLFLAAWRYGRRLYGKHGFDRPNPPATKDIPNDDEHP